MGSEEQLPASLVCSHFELPDLAGTDCETLLVNARIPRSVHPLAELRNVAEVLFSPKDFWIQC
jgi:hypothetical protein